LNANEEEAEDIQRIYDCPKETLTKCPVIPPTEWDYSPDWV